MLRLLIPMAGNGQRFSDAGYELPKPLIDVDGRPMIERVIENLTPKHTNHQFIFLCQRSHLDNFPEIEKSLWRDEQSDSHITIVDGVTEGAACTALLARNNINNDDPLIIANCDQLVDQERMDAFHSFIAGSNVDGAIMTFPATEEKWSYAKSLGGYVTEVAEKRVISDDATVGIYYFRRGSDFVRAAEQMIARNVRHNNEFYLCPVYNELIADGGKVMKFDIAREHMHGLGTPEDLTAYLTQLSHGNN